MPSSPAPTTPPTNDHQLDDEEEEYDEIEVEEEIEEEVEEEISEEEEEEEEEEEVNYSDDDFGEDLTPIREDQIKDVSKVMKSNGQEEHWRSVASAPEKSVGNVLPDRPAVDNSCVDSKIHDVSDTKKWESRVIGEDFNSSTQAKDGFSGQADGVQYCEEDTKQMEMQSAVDIKQMAPRLAVPQLRPRSLSPNSQFLDGNKRPATVCSFFAKGWCVKGNSCRFLHVEDHVDITSQSNEGVLSAASHKSEILADEGLRERIGHSGLLGIPDSAASSVSHGADVSDRTPPSERGKSPMWKSESQVPLCENIPRSMSSSMDVDVDGFTQNRHGDDHGNFGSTVIRAPSQVSFPGTLSNCSLYATNFEELPSKRHQSMLGDSTLSGINRSRDSLSNTSLLTTGILPSNDISPWSKSPPLSFSASWNQDSIGATKLFHSNIEHHASKYASLKQSSSPFSRYESESLSWPNVSSDLLRSAGYTTKISSYDWEPSVPFRPSFSLTRSLLSSGSLYDPICDSIEQPNLGQGLCWRTHGDPVSSSTFVPEYSSNRHSIYGQQDINGHLLDRDDYGYNLLTTETETAGTTPAELQKRKTVTKEEKLLSPAHVRDVAEADKLSVYHDSAPKSNESGERTGATVGRYRKTKEMDVEDKAYGDMHKESKAWKHFHAALVEFVKELVRPTWEEGHMSKDAFKKIAKKAVDKVLNTLPPHQIPSTAESIKHYLSFSQPKIAKLVKGYIEKYGKA